MKYDEQIALLEKMYCDIRIMCSTKSLEYVDALYVRSVQKLNRFYRYNVKRLLESEEQKDE